VAVAVHYLLSLVLIAMKTVKLALNRQQSGLAVVSAYLVCTWYLQQAGKKCVAAEACWQQNCSSSGSPAQVAQP
jgi:hypothetical protein